MSRGDEIRSLKIASWKKAKEEMDKEKKVKGGEEVGVWQMAEVGWEKGQQERRARFNRKAKPQKDSPTKIQFIYIITIGIEIQQRQNIK